MTIKQMINKLYSSKTLISIRISGYLSLLIILLATVIELANNIYTNYDSSISLFYIILALLSLHIIFKKKLYTYICRLENKPMVLVIGYSVLTLLALLDMDSLSAYITIVIIILITLTLSLIYRCYILIFKHYHLANYDRLMFLLMAITVGSVIPYTSTSFSILVFCMYCFNNLLYTANKAYTCRVRLC